jgi:hypothetical protein
MRVNDVLRARAHSEQDGTNSAREVEVGRNYADRRSLGASVTMLRQRCFDGTSPSGAPAALGTHQRGGQHVTLSLPGLGQQRPPGAAVA